MVVVKPRGFVVVVLAALLLLFSFCCIILIINKRRDCIHPSGTTCAESVVVRIEPPAKEAVTTAALGYTTRNFGVHEGGLALCHDAREVQLCETSGEHGNGVLCTCSHRTLVPRPMCTSQLLQWLCKLVLKVAHQQERVLILEHIRTVFALLLFFLCMQHRAVCGKMQYGR